MSSLAHENIFASLGFGVKTPSMAAINSGTFRYRSSGFLARHFRMISAIPGGMSELKPLGGDPENCDIFADLDETLV